MPTGCRTKELLYEPMKTLYLLRHAKSSWKYPDIADKARPLNKRGKQDAPALGHWLKQQAIIPDRIISSPSVRTLTTISKLTHAIGLKGDAIETDSTLYHAEPLGLLSIIHSCPREVASLMLVGHNPGLTALARLLCPAEAPDNIPTCGLFALQFSTQSWAEAGTKNALFLFFQYPKKLYNH